MCKKVGTKLRDLIYFSQKRRPVSYHNKLYELEAYFCIKGSVGGTDLAKLVYVLEVDIFAKSDSAIYPRFFNGLQLLSNLSTKECL